jgi:hypothetical protein
MHDRVVAHFASPSAPHFIAIRWTVMTDQELICAALRQVGLIVAEHLESRTSEADEAISQLVAILDTPELAAAMNRVERGHGLRILK